LPLLRGGWRHAVGLRSGRRHANISACLQRKLTRIIEITVRKIRMPPCYEIRQLDEDPGPMPFQVSAAWRTKMFDLAHN